MAPGSLGRCPEFGEVDAEPFLQARLAGLGHGDDAAGFLVVIQWRSSKVLVRVRGLTVRWPD